MSDNDEIELVVNIDEWIDKAKADPEAYLERQATEIFLTTLGTTEPYCGKFYLKGGILMGIVYNSPRQTADIDLSTQLEPNPNLAEHLREHLNKAFPQVAAKLGYPDIMLKIHKIELRPYEKIFTEARAPGIDLEIGYAKRGSPEEKGFEKNNPSKRLEADISFKEPIGSIQIVRLEGSGSTITVYSLKDLITEKLRALLQQEERKRNRRQDIYDLNLILTKFHFDSTEVAEMLTLLKTKCEARGITPAIDSLQAKEIVRRARTDWETMKVEIGELPDFDDCFKVVNDFYRSLPWK